MAFAVGVLELPNASIGSLVTETGLAFQPDAIFFFQFGVYTADGIYGNNLFGMGFMADDGGGGIDEGSRFSWGRTGLTTSDEARGGDSVALNQRWNSGSFFKVSAGAFTSDGFSVNYDVGLSGTRRLPYLAIKADNVKLITLTAPTSTGLATITGVGFQPKVLLNIAGLFSSTETDDTDYSDARIGFGFACDDGVAIKQALMSVFHDDAKGTSVAQSGLVNDCFNGYKGSGQSLDFTVKGDVQSMNADGFTIDWTSVSASTLWQSLVLCFDSDGEIDDAFSFKTSTGLQTVTGLSAQPEAVIAMGTRTTTIPGYTNDGGHGSYMTLGIATLPSPNENAVIGIGNEGSEGTTDLLRFTETDRLLRFYDFADVEQASADLKSFESDGFVLDWTAAVSPAEYGAWLALSTPVVGGVTVPVMDHHYRTRRAS